MSPDRVLKYNETNIGLQKKLSSAAQKTAPAAAAKAAPPKEGISSTASTRVEGREGRTRKEQRGHKRGRDEVRRVHFHLHVLDLSILIPLLYPYFNPP